MISYAHWLCDSYRLLLIFRLQNRFCPKWYTGFMKCHSSPFNSMIVFLCRSWYFSTFNYNSCPFLCSSFFLKVWISLSITYRQTFELTCASSFPDLHILRYWWPPSHPLGVNVITECPICYFSAVSQKKWTKLIFCMQINIKRFYQLILTIFPSKFCTRWYYQYWWTW